MSSLLAGLDESRRLRRARVRLLRGHVGGLDRRGVARRRLGAGRAPGRPRRGRCGGAGARTSSARRRCARRSARRPSLAGAAAAPFASLAFASTAEAVRCCAARRCDGCPRAGARSPQLGRMVEQAGVRWDGRLRVTAVELESGRRVVFGAPGEPQPPVSLAVQASCAIPGVFAPVASTGETYVDGGAWSPTNMDAAEVPQGTGMPVLEPDGLAAPVRRRAGRGDRPLSRGAAATEALVLQRPRRERDDRQPRCGERGGDGREPDGP